jgi:hypothetical protein
MPIDYSLYPPNWKAEIVPAVLQRANNCCEKCGLQNAQTVYAIKLWVKDINKYKLRSLWFSREQDAKREASHGIVKPVRVVLTIAHLDHDADNHDVMLERLMALCQICHLRYDAKEKYRRSLVKWADKPADT